MLTHTETAQTFLTHREARGRLCRYMTGLGYKVIGTDNDLLFERGSSLGNIPGSPPRQWKIRVFAHISKAPNGTRVLIRWEFPKGVRVISVWDARYFKREVQGAVKTLGASEVSLKTLDELHTTNSLITLTVYLTAFLVIAVTTVLMAIGDISVTVWLLPLLIVGTLLIAIRAPIGVASGSRKAPQAP